MSRAELGEDWPFTVEEGQITCDGDAVYFRADNRTHAVNGTARGRSPELDTVDEIWADDPDVSGLKVDISPIISRGLELCDS